MATLVYMQIGIRILLWTEMASQYKGANQSEKGHILLLCLKFLLHQHIGVFHGVEMNIVCKDLQITLSFKAQPQGRVEKLATQSSISNYLLVFVGAAGRADPGKQINQSQSLQVWPMQVENELYRCVKSGERGKAGL